MQAIPQYKIDEFVRAVRRAEKLMKKELKYRSWAKSSTDTVQQEKFYITSRETRMERRKLKG